MNRYQRIKRDISGLREIKSILMLIGGFKGISVNIWSDKR